MVFFCFYIDNKNASPAIQPLTIPADWSITPSPARMASEAEVTASEIETPETTQTKVNMNQGSSKREDDQLDLSANSVIIPTVVAVAVVFLSLLIIYLVVRVRRFHRQKKSASRSSSSLDEEMKEGKIEALKTISSTTTTSTSSVDDEEAPSPSTDISLHHWTSKKAVSNRYESWHIGEIDQEWVCRRLLAFFMLFCKTLTIRIWTLQRNKNQLEDGWEFPRHHLHVISILGEGCFGQVWKCQALGIAGLCILSSSSQLMRWQISNLFQSMTGHEGSSTVAVKTLKESAGDKERQDLLKELQVMKTLKPHPNIVTLLGCCTDKGQLFSTKSVRKMLLSGTCIIIDNRQLTIHNRHLFNTRL